MMSILSSLMAMVGIVKAEEITMGAPVPEVSVQTHEGETIDLRKEASEGYALVYFYPKADTPGCTKQACSLRDAYEKLTEKGVRVFGVSGDDVEAQADFAKKFDLPFTLLADPDKKVIKAFGVPAKMGFAKRQAYFFEDGKLIWRDLTASTEQQAADVLKAIES
ncbi:MAG: peroxiredoxin [Verrucomicrobiota bacterium JB023]|nr:peroxiredoxin [Verrucomicrobiota bacterium JB023]